MSENKLNISKHTNALMRQLGVQPTMVRSLYITPTQVEAEMFVPNDKGEKVLVGGEVPMTTRTWEVRT